MKLLIITYSYSPDLTPRAFRWAAVAKELAQAGHEVEVLCASREQENFSEDAVVVHRVRDWLLNASTRVTAGSDASNVRQTAHILTTARGILRRLVRSLWKALHWPDYAVGWVIPAVLMTKALYKENAYDWVITVSHPFSSHLVGLLSGPKAFGANWLVDIGDPFYLISDPSPNNRLLYGWLSKLVEKKVIAAANAISVTTESTRTLYENHFAEASNKIKVVPPLLSLPEAPERTVYEARAPIRLVFVGTLYKNLRNPRFMLSCFEALGRSMSGRRIELHFYGAINDCGPELEAYASRVQSCLHAHGMVTRREVVQAMVDADVLVNIGNRSESQLASKVIEYMAIGRPILNFVSSERDTSVAAIGDYPMLVIKDESQGISAQLIDTIRTFVTDPPCVHAAEAARIRELYSPERVAAQYASILKSVNS